MGVSYTDDLSGKALDSKNAYQLQITKFESDKKLIKSKKFYVSLDSLKNAIGDQDMQWTTLEKREDGQWVQV